ncbi:MAG TPA: acyl-CoA dehydrogenase family protein [Kofleriaceae bacterium]|jgi:alkylation response protein AidB-like acyl-CoA dehydrogenase|nr:acyl-CoA dehydrogenase family protein [Kofleriaceae bacterium]
MDALLRFVLDPAHRPLAIEELRGWWDATAALRATWTDPFDRAFAGGACADRIGFAFVCGYTEALRALVPDLLPGSITALCATEEGGAYPRAIHTRLVKVGPGRYELSGRKKWATVASTASSLLVVASTGEEGGKNRLRVVRVRADAPGVRLRSSTAVFVPEIPHAEVEFDGVIASDADVLPGDGYDAYLKPFRTIEDIHVHAALAGYLIGVARRRGFPRDLQERLLVLAVATRSFAHADPKAATTHVAFAGLLEVVHRLVGEIESLWAAVPDAEWSRWQRDRALLRVASSARAARRERAWSILDSVAPAGSPA